MERISLAIEGRLNRGRLPLALVALDEGRPVGTVSLKVREVEIRPQLECWLGAIYVREPDRGRGFGQSLVEVAEYQASMHGVQDLYLYTRRQQTENWYAGLGWQVTERLLYHGRPAVIMTRPIGAENGS